MVKSYLKILCGMVICILLLVGCAPPREKPNDEAKNTSGSEELDQAIVVLKSLGVDLNLDDIQTLGKENSEGVSNLLPDPAVLANMTEEQKADLDNAIVIMQSALDQLEDPNSFQAAYVHLYLGYAYILAAVAEMSDPVNYPDLGDIVTKVTTSPRQVAGESAPPPRGKYQFNAPPFVVGPDGKLSPAEVNADPVIANAEMQAVLNAAYLLMGEAYAPPAGLGWLVTGPDDDALNHRTTALAELQKAADLIGVILPDSTPEELEKIKTELQSGVTDDIRTTITGWGFTLITE